MITDMKIRDRLVYNTIQIIGDQCTGTGFFFDLSQSKGFSEPVIVTNKHVIGKQKHGKLLFHKSDHNGDPELGQFIEINLDNFESLWIDHPDQNIDLCCMPIVDIVRSNPEIIYTLMDFELIPTKEELEKHKITTIEDVLVVGYPNGLKDHINNFPIIRKGITSTNMNISYNGNNDFVIDAGIYPGSSGSPVFLQLPFEGRYSNLSDWFYLIGIIHQVHQHSVELDIPNIGSAVIYIPNGLGIAVNANKLYDFVSLIK